MNIAKNTKRLREERGLMQKEVASAVGEHPSNYSKTEKSEREFGIDAIDRLAAFFGLTIYEPAHPIIDIMLAKSKFQAFFEQNIAVK